MHSFDDNLLYIVKCAILVQISIIILLILATALSKYYFKRRKEKQDKESASLKKTLIEVAEQKQDLNDKVLKRCNHSMTILLPIIRQLDEELNTPHWQNVRQTIITDVILPNARKLSSSKKWFKRYMATQCFNLGRGEDDNKYIIKLIKDPILLVSLNAAEVAVKHPSEELIQAIINTYSQARQIQSATFIKILSNSQLNIAPLIQKHLLEEKDPYARAFCYRVLSDLPAQNDVTNIAYSDVLDSNTNLQISSMNYLAHNNDPKIVQILRENLDNPKWQVRSAAVRLLGYLKSNESAELIANKLKDPEWWVRMNAAQSLAQLGAVGMGHLKAYGTHEDYFASEAATHVLRTLTVEDEMNEQNKLNELNQSNDKDDLNNLPEQDGLKE